MSFFVSKDIQERLDEETLSSQSLKEKDKSNDYCQLCLEHGETLCYYKIKKFNFLKLNHVDITVESDAKFLANLLSNRYKIIKIEASDHNIPVVSYSIKTGEINVNGCYDLVISCLTE